MTRKRQIAARLGQIGSEIHTVIETVIGEAVTLTVGTIGEIMDDVLSYIEDLKSKYVSDKIAEFAILYHLPALTKSALKRKGIAFLNMERQIKETVHDSVPYKIEGFFARFKDNLTGIVKEGLVKLGLSEASALLPSDSAFARRVKQVLKAAPQTVAAEVNWFSPDSVLNYIRKFTAPTEKDWASLSGHLEHEVRNVISRATDLAPQIADETVSECQQAIEVVTKSYGEVVSEVAGLLAEIAKHLKEASDNLQAENYGKLHDAVQQAYDLSAKLDGIYHEHRELFGHLGYNFADVVNSIGEISGAADRLLQGAEPIDRLQLAQNAIGAIYDTFFDDEFTIEDILEETKEEIRRALGGNSVAFVVHSGAVTQSRVHEYYFNDLMEKWAFGGDGAFDHFVTKVYGEKLAPADLENMKTLFKYWLKEGFFNTVSPLSTLGAVTPKEADKLLVAALKEIVEKIFAAFPPPKKIPVDDAVAYFKGRREFANNIVATLTKVKQKDAPPSFLVFYITTDLEDYLYLGTELDAHPTSCFWTDAGNHSIPSILVGRNVAVCYVFYTTDETLLAKANIPIPKPPNEIVEQVNPNIDAIRQQLKVVGRTLIVVDANGRVTKTKRGNTYTDFLPPNMSAHAVWGVLRHIIDRKFANVRLKETEWYYIPPSV